MNTLGKANFNMGSTMDWKMPLSVSQVTFKEHKGSYNLTDMHRNGIKLKNKRCNFSLKHP